MINNLIYCLSFFRKIHFGIGTDLFYDSGVKSSLLGIDKIYKSIYHFQTGIHVSQSIVYNKFRISIQEGVYLLLREKVNEYSIYNRGIIQYEINDKTSVRLSMKSHLHILDYPEIGFGFKL